MIPPVSTAEPGTRLPREIWVLVGSAFMIAVGFGVVAPALPTFARTFDVSVTAASAVISAFAFFRLAFAPVSGRLVNAFGELRVYLIGLFVVAASTGATAFAQAYWQLLLFRALGGIGSTMFTVSAISLLVRLAPPAMRGRASGTWATGFLLGNVAGPLVGGGLVTISIRAPFLAYAIILVITAGVGWLLLRRSRLLGPAEQGAPPAMSFRAALTYRVYRAALSSSFANGWVVLGVRIALIPLFVVEVLDEEPSWAGVALTVFAVGNVAALPIAGRIADNRGRRLPLLAGLLVSAGANAWLGFTDALPLFLVASLVAGVGSGLMNPPMNAAVADVIGSRSRGGPVLAGFQMAADVGAILGPILAGLIAQATSFSWAFAVTGTICLMAFAVWLRAPETLGHGARSDR